MQFIPFSAPLDPTTQTVNSLRHELRGLFDVSGVRVREGRDLTITFTGEFGGEDATFDAIRQRFHSLGFTPFLRREGNQDVLVALQGLVDEGRPGNPLINLLLFLVTVLTTLSAGAAMVGEDGLFAALTGGSMADAAAAAVAGAPFALTLLTILGVHEFGHYAAARWHGVTATLPYFIPLPIGGLGTLGAFISVRSPMKDRTVLFDIGLAGPIAGFIVAVPLLVLGIALSEPASFLAQGMTLRTLGSSVFIDVLLNALVDLGPGQTLALHPVFFAAWFGILITSINLLPIGQLDGGHVAYGLLGRKAHTLARGTLILLIVAGLTLSSTWLLWALFVLFGGLHHPPPLNDISGVNRERRIIGALTAGLFLVTVVPVPFR